MWKDFNGWINTPQVDRGAMSIMIAVDSFSGSVIEQLIRWAVVVILVETLSGWDDEDVDTLSGWDERWAVGKMFRLVRVRDVVVLTSVELEQGWLLPGDDIFSELFCSKLYCHNFIITRPWYWPKRNSVSHRREFTFETDWSFAHRYNKNIPSLQNEWSRQRQRSIPRWTRSRSRWQRFTKSKKCHRGSEQ